MKRIISIVLVLALAVSLMPAVFAATGWENDEVFVYEFSQASHGINLGTNASVFSSSTNQSIGKTAEGYLPWGYVGAQDRASITTVAESSVPGSALLWTFYLDTDVEDVNGVTSVRPFNPEETRNQRAIMLELEIKKAGTFRPQVDYVVDKASVIMEYHLVKKKSGEKGYDGENLSNYVKKLDASTRLGVVDQSTGSGIAKFPAFTVETGNYYFIGIPVGSNPNCVFKRNKESHASMPNRAYMATYIKKFTLSVVHEASEEIKFDYIFNSQSFNLSSTVLVNGDEAEEGYLGYWGGDSSSNSNRSANGGWVGSKASSIASAVIRGGKTYGQDAHTYLNKEKTAPWMFFPRSQNNVYIDNTVTYMNCTKVNGNSAALIYAINIPITGKYEFSFAGVKGGTTDNGSGTVIQGADGAVHFVDSVSIPGNSDLNSDNRIGMYKFYEEGLVGSATKSVTENMGTIKIERAGTYFVVIQLRKDGGAKEFANAIAPEGTTTSEYASHYLARVKGITLRRTGMLDDEVAIESKKNEEIDVDSGSAAPEDINISTEATVSAFAAYLGGGEIASEIIRIEKTQAGEDFKLTAPTDKDGYKFLYWAKAASNSRIVVSDNPEYTFRPVLGASNSYIAVYKSENAVEENKAEFYDANGQLLETYKAADVAPALPSMPGFGKAKYWACYGSDEKLNPGAAFEVSGTKMYVAYYEEENEPSVSVTVNGKQETVEYGKLYELTAPARSEADASKVFCYWTKNDEIVSFDKNYSFYAAENCVIEAVYGDYAPSEMTLRKIIFSTISGGRTHAEFIGLSDAVEKGIIFGNNLLDATHRITMKTDGKQFTFIDDVNTDYIGYAILESGKVVYSK